MPTSLLKNIRAQIHAILLLNIPFGIMPNRIVRFDGQGPWFHAFGAPMRTIMSSSGGAPGSARCSRLIAWSHRATEIGNLWPMPGRDGLWHCKRLANFRVSNAEIDPNADSSLDAASRSIGYVDTQITRVSDTRCQAEEAPSFICNAVAGAQREMCVRKPSMQCNARLLCLSMLDLKRPRDSIRISVYGFCRTDGS